MCTKQEMLIIKFSKIPNSIDRRCVSGVLNFKMPGPQSLRDAGSSVPCLALSEYE